MSACRSRRRCSARWLSERQRDSRSPQQHPESRPRRLAVPRQRAVRKRHSNTTTKQTLHTHTTTSSTYCFKLIDEIMTEEMVPDLLTRMDGKDPLVKMHLINVLARFDRPDVSKALQEQLRDCEQARAQAALAGIARSKSTVDVQMISALLLDPDLDVMNKAVDVIVQAERSGDREVPVARAQGRERVQPPGRGRDLERDRHDAQRQVPARSVPTTTGGCARAPPTRWRASAGQRVVDAVLELIKDKDENIRRAAIEILNTCRDKRAVDKLIEATKDKDWWVSERAADALAEIGDAKALPALLEMVAKNNRSLPVAHRGASASSAISRCSTRSCRFCSAPRKRCGSRRSAPSRSSPASSRPRPYAAHSAGRGRRRGDRATRGHEGAAEARGPLSPSGRFTSTATSPGLSANRDADAARRCRRQRARNPRGRRCSRPAPRRRRRRRRRRPPARCSSKAPKTQRRPPPPEAPSFDLNALQTRRHDRRPLQVHPEDRQRRVRHRRARRGHRRRGAPDPEVLERERVLRRGDAEAVRARAALLAPHHAQERHPHLRFPVRRRQLRDLDGVLPFAHARRGDREREAHAAEEGRRLRQRHLHRHERRAPARHHPPRLEAGEHPDQRRRAC